MLSSVSDSLNSGLTTLVNGVPHIIAAVLVLIVGWIIAGIIGNVVRKVLDKAGVDRVTQRAGIDSFFMRAGMQNVSAGRILGLAVTWWIRLMVVEIAVDALGLSAVTAFMNSVVAYIPSLIVAVIIVGVAAFLGKLAGEAVRGAARGAGVGNPNLLGSVVQMTVIVLGVVAALQQAHIAETLVNELTIAALAVVAGSCILAFGLGGRSVAEKMLMGAYEKGQQAAQTAQQNRQQQQQQQPQQQSQTQASLGGRPMDAQSSQGQPQQSPYGSPPPRPYPPTYR